MTDEEEESIQVDDEDVCKRLKDCRNNYVGRLYSMKDFVGSCFVPSPIEDKANRKVEGGEN